MFLLCVPSIASTAFFHVQDQLPVKQTRPYAYDIVVADTFQSITATGQVGTRKYRVKLGLGPLDTDRVIVSSNDVTGTRTTVDGSPAVGVFPAWARPVRMIQTFAVSINDKAITVPPEYYRDVFNLRLEPIGGTTPPSGNLLIWVEKGSGALRIDVRPLPAPSYEDQGTSMECNWRINTDGEVQRRVLTKDSRGTASCLVTGRPFRWESGWKELHDGPSLDIARGEE